MHLSPWAFATFITAATAATLKVNYYSDGGCSKYMTSITPGTGNSCIDYVWDGSNSINIADCTFPNGKCVCTFYVQPHCNGASHTLVYGGDNCASNWGRGFYSMKCHIEHGL
ncbi:hypothetical protein Asppvi_005193 [Aspergillus pseudoviridinutans]|uniref:Small secreted protein n=1 Tax=Aspergillus pseudoviridinutans TaxID=1517512 RepID=A0A9P3ESD7_9EURO|nr:uncharacterized protein Asppvi_005193 [Aspergillus pseudoviridinutans]GIJ86306.1 hypothetical protein Asppvi_005193 [Aspergillus pseudoviridinutans]